MKKATVANLEIVDNLARHYLSKHEPETIMEVVLLTKAKEGDEVRITIPYTVRRLIRSRYISSITVAHFTAAEWTSLRKGTPQRQPGAPDHDQVAPPKR